MRRNGCFIRGNLIILYRGLIRDLHNFQAKGTVNDGKRSGRSKVSNYEKIDIIEIVVHPSSSTVQVAKLQYTECWPNRNSTNKNWKRGTDFQMTRPWSKTRILWKYVHLNCVTCSEIPMKLFWRREPTTSLCHKLLAIETFASLNFSSKNFIRLDITSENKHYLNITNCICFSTDIWFILIWLWFHCFGFCSYIFYHV